MSSRLATRLIGLARKAGNHSDMIWKYSDLNEVDAARTPVSDELVIELVTFLDGTQATHFATILPSLGAVNTALATRSSAALRLGAAKNPHADDALLTELASSGGQAAEFASQRVAARDSLRQALLNGTDSDIAVAYEAVASLNDAHALASIIEGNEDKILPLIGSDNRWVLRSLVSDELDHAARDRVNSLLIGVLDDSLAASKVDETLVEWLLEADTTRAEASRTELESDRNSVRMLLSRLTDASMHRFLASERFGDLARGTLGRRRTTSMVGGNPLDVGMLSTLRLAGMGVDEIASLIFSSRVPLDVQQLVSELDGLSANRLAAFLSGQTMRHPAPGETDALLGVRDLEEQELVAQALEKDISDLPWYDELLIGIPRRFVPVDDLRSMRILDGFLNEELGTDAKAWEIVLAMSTEWEGSLRSLTNAARHL